MKLFYTHSDLDGISNILVAKYYLREELNDFEIIIINYSDMETNSVDYEKLSKAEEVIFTDFCPDEKMIDVIETNNIPTKVFDHHDSAIQMIDEIKERKSIENIEFFFDDTVCGTEIFYNYCKENYKEVYNLVLNQIVFLTDTYDMWRDDSEHFSNAVDFNRLLFKYMNYNSEGIDKYMPFLDRMMKKIETNDALEYTKEELEKIEYDKKIETGIVISANKSIRKRIDSKGKKFGILLLDKKISLVAYRILSKHTDLTYLIIVNTYNPDELKMSIRSLKSSNFDCRQIKGFEGHANASGYKVKDFKAIKRLSYALWTGKLKYLDYKE